MTIPAENDTSAVSAEQTGEQFSGLDAVMRSLQVGVLLAKDRKVIWANQRFFDMLGYQQSELLGQSTRLYFYTEEGYQSIGSEGYPLLIQGLRYATERELIRKDRSTFWAHITGNAVDLNDLTQGFIWSFADITDRKRAEEEVRATLEDLRNTQAQLVEAEKMAALGGLVAGVAHEINTPIGVGLTVVTHFQNKTNELLALFENNQMKKTDLQKYLALAKESAVQLVSNIARASDLIQSFKRVAVDQTSDHQRTFQLHSYLNEIITSLTPTLRKGGHQVEIDCPDNIEMNSFPGSLAQIISNLVMNALMHAFTPQGGGGLISIRVELKSGMVELGFTDNGAGIPADHLPRIFDPFFTTKRGSGGSGLGLNIVYNLVTQKLHGRITCKSEVNKGTTFLMVLPIAAGMEQQKPPST
jgi:PAS domain S-box-containing protein